jgi:hypothetical protein
MDLDAKIARFWSWFAENRKLLQGSAVPQALLTQLTLQLESIDERLSWELGPGKTAPAQLVISPNLQREVFQISTRIISLAPHFDGWDFFPARPQKQWSSQILLNSDEGTGMAINCDSWIFVLLEYPDDAKEILLSRESSDPILSERQRWEASTIFLESELGEQNLLNLECDYELLDNFEPRFANVARSARILREVLFRI